MSYNPVTGEGWDRAAATVAWGKSMQRCSPRWVLRGQPVQWVWSFFNFGPWTGTVMIQDDGFHWATASYDTGQEIHSGVTTSLYAAFNSVERNEPTEPPRAEPSADDNSAR